MISRIAAVCSLPAVLALQAADALACSVCYGDPAAAASKGLTSAVLTLLAITAVVLLGFGWCIFSLWRHARRSPLPVPRAPVSHTDGGIA